MPLSSEVMQQQVTATPCFILPFGQRTHYLRVITDERRIDARHFQELPNKLKEKAELESPSKWHFDRLRLGGRGLGP